MNLYSGKNFVKKLKIKGAFNIELWKRKNARLSFDWNCEKFEEYEDDLPRYTKIKRKRSKTKTHNWLQTFFYAHEVRIKYLISFLVFLGMVGLFTLVYAFFIGIMNYKKF